MVVRVDVVELGEQVLLTLELQLSREIRIAARSLRIQHSTRSRKTKEGTVLYSYSYSVRTTVLYKHKALRLQSRRVRKHSTQLENEMWCESIRADLIKAT